MLLAAGGRGGFYRYATRKIIATSNEFAQMDPMPTPMDIVHSVPSDPPPELPHPNTDGLRTPTDFSEMPELLEH